MGRVVELVRMADGRGGAWGVVVWLVPAVLWLAVSYLLTADTWQVWAAFAWTLVPPALVLVFFDECRRQWSRWLILQGFAYLGGNGVFVLLAFGWAWLLGSRHVQRWCE